MLRRHRQLAIVWDEISWNWRENRKYTFLSLHKQPFITAQSPVITAHFVYHCTLFYALLWWRGTRSWRWWVRHDP